MIYSLARPEFPFEANKIRVLKWPENFANMEPIKNLWEILKNEIHLEPIKATRKKII